MRSNLKTSSLPERKKPPFDNPGPRLVTCCLTEWALLLILLMLLLLPLLTFANILDSKEPCWRRRSEGVRKQSASQVAASSFDGITPAQQVSFRAEPGTDPVLAFAFASALVGPGAGSAGRPEAPPPSPPQPGGGAAAAREARPTQIRPLIARPSCPTR